MPNDMTGLPTPTGWARPDSTGQNLLQDREFGASVRLDGDGASECRGRSRDPMNGVVCSGGESCSGGVGETQASGLRVVRVRPSGDLVPECLPVDAQDLRGSGSVAVNRGQDAPDVLRLDLGQRAIGP